MIKSRRKRWARHVIHMGQKRNACKVLMGKPEGKKPLGRPRNGGSMILRWILEKEDGVVWLDSSGSG
jgi:hypothetical protein